GPVAQTGGAGSAIRGSFGVRPDQYGLCLAENAVDGPDCFRCLSGYLRSKIIRGGLDLEQSGTARTFRRTGLAGTWRGCVHLVAVRLAVAAAALVRRL